MTPHSLTLPRWASLGKLSQQLSVGSQVRAPRCGGCSVQPRPGSESAPSAQGGLGLERPSRGCQPRSAAQARGACTGLGCVFPFRGPPASTSGTAERSPSLLQSSAASCHAPEAVPGGGLVPASRPRGPACCRGSREQSAWCAATSSNRLYCDQSPLGTGGTAETVAEAAPPRGVWPSLAGPLPSTGSKGTRPCGLRPRL